MASFRSMTVTNAPLKTAETTRREIALRVEAEMTRLLYRSAAFGLVSNFVLAGILVAGLWTYFPPVLTLGWLVGISAASLARWALNLRFARHVRIDDELPYWRKLFFCGVVVAGGVWGIGGCLFLSTGDLLPLVRRQR